MTSSDVLPDVLAPGMRVVFCGTAAGTASARAGAYYAGPGNRFWATLHEIGLTPHLLRPAEYGTLPTWGIGLTDVCKTAHGADRDIAPGAYEPDRLAKVIAQFAPTALAFTSKKAAATAFGLRDGVSYGLQDRRLGGAQTWVVPSPSGAARGWWRIEPWRALAQAVGDG